MLLQCTESVMCFPPKKQRRCGIGDGGKTRDGDNWSQAPSVPCTLYPAPPAPDFWHPLVPPVPCTRVLVPPVPCTRVLVTPLLLLSPAATVQLLKSPRFTVFFCFLTRRCSFFPPFLIFNFLTTCIVGCTISNGEIHVSCSQGGRNCLSH